MQSLSLSRAVSEDCCSPTLRFTVLLLRCGRALNRWLLALRGRVPCLLRQLSMRPLLLRQMVMASGPQPRGDGATIGDQGVEVRAADLRVTSPTSSQARLTMHGFTTGLRLATAERMQVQTFSSRRRCMPPPHADLTGGMCKGNFLGVHFDALRSLLGYFLAVFGFFAAAFRPKGFQKGGPRAAILRRDRSDGRFGPIFGPGLTISGASCCT